MPTTVPYLFFEIVLLHMLGKSAPSRAFFVFCSSICGKSEANMPYGELGHVGKSNCLCCVSLSSAFGEVSPGCGCDEALVDTVVADLKKRQEGRGDQGQVQRQEAMMEEIETINTKLDAIMDHLKMQQMERS